MDDHNLDTKNETTDTIKLEEPKEVPVSPNSSPAVSAESKTDILGIISIVTAFIGMQLIGLIIGLVGASKAKKEGRSPTLSRIGWILNVVTLLILIPVVIFGVMAFNNAQNKAEKALKDTKQSQYYDDKTKTSETDEMNKTVELKKGEAIVAEGVSIKVNSVTRNYVPSIEYQKAKDGKELIVIDVTVSNVTQKEQYVYRSALKLSDGDNQETYSFAKTPQPELKSGSIEAGKTVQGQLVFEISKDSNDLELLYTGYSTDKETYRSIKTEYRLKV